MILKILHDENLEFHAILNFLMAFMCIRNKRASSFLKALSFPTDESFMMKLQVDVTSELLQLLTFRFHSFFLSVRLPDRISFDRRDLHRSAV